MDVRRFAFLFALASSVFVWAAALHPAEIPSAEAFGAVPYVSEVELSPNGKLIAWRQPGPNGTLAMIHDLDVHATKRSILFDSDVKIRSLAWADDETLL